jgi:hypothetical protein
MNIAEVRDLLDHLNDRLYGGKIFRARVVSAPRTEMGGLYAGSNITWDGDGRYIVEATIRFDENDLNRSDEEVALTAYHELNHVAGGPDDGHGPRWVRRMESGGAKVIYRRKVDGSVGASQRLIPGSRLDDALKEFWGNTAGARQGASANACGQARAGVTLPEDWAGLVDGLFRRSDC